MKNRLRIIGGDWRGRKISFATAEGLRPTPDRVRETLFNWLQFSIVGARCLDVFAGSGILGLEAASRGASSVLLIENNIYACAAIREAIGLLGASQVELHHADAIEVLATGANETYDIVFLDPPFHKGLVGVALNLLNSRGWLHSGSKVYIEKGKDVPLELPSEWHLLKSAKAGDVAYYLSEKQ